MLGKKMVSIKKLAKKVKGVGIGGGADTDPAHYECLLKEYAEGSPSNVVTPTGFFALYVGEERQRYVIPTTYLSHPLFKILLEKVYDEFGFEQRNALVIPCSVSTFQEVLNAIECSNGLSLPLQCASRFALCCLRIQKRDNQSNLQSNPGSYYVEKPEISSGIRK